MDAQEAYFMLIFYVMGALFAGFFATTDIFQRYGDYAFTPPQRTHILHEGRLRWPFVYGLKVTVDPESYPAELHRRQASDLPDPVLRQKQ